MHHGKWLLALTAVIVSGLIAGCGSSDSSSTSSTAATGGSASTTSASTSGSTPDDVYNACIDALSGTAAESTGKTACAQARTAFQQCSEQAGNLPDGSQRDTAVQACQDAADKTTAALNASP
jgi:hypothetical protein